MRLLATDGTVYETSLSAEQAQDFANRLRAGHPVSYFRTNVEPFVDRDGSLGERDSTPSAAA